MSGEAALVQSVQARLLTHARAIGSDPNLVLTRYAVERFLYRLSRSPDAERFVLKGALLILAWLGDGLRPTRDADLLGFGELDDEALTGLFAAICSVDVQADGMQYLADSVRVAPIRAADAYGGQRVTLMAMLGPARLRVQVDVGIGDAMVPAPGWLDYPSLLDLPRPHLRAYAPETVVAEKLHAVVVLGARNSRMKDYYDLHALIEAGIPDASQLIDAITATFQRRGTLLPTAVPLGLDENFALDGARQAQWAAFLDRNRLDAPELGQVLDVLRRYLEPPLRTACEQEGKVWRA
ncbi:MAG: nucleotidyl transferase AbiEii/AbiGii toxin family protein [Chloroflexota bacterium]|nr:nucleotidyl transferase AbiEii/AbiGii toxin family protein [Chloroflexota bacterium]